MEIYLKLYTFHPGPPQVLSTVDWRRSLVYYMAIHCEERDRPAATTRPRAVAKCYQRYAVDCRLFIALGVQLCILWRWPWHTASRGFVCDCWVLLMYHKCSKLSSICYGFLAVKQQQILQQIEPMKFEHRPKIVIRVYILVKENNC